MVTFLAYSSVFQEYAKRGAYAYVSMIQREERKNKVHGRSWVLRDGDKHCKKRQKLPTAELFQRADGTIKSQNLMGFSMVFPKIWWDQMSDDTWWNIMVTTVSDIDLTFPNPKKHLFFSCFWLDFMAARR